MLGAFVFLGGAVLVIFVLPLWLVTRRGRHVVGPVVETVDYEQPYPGLGMLATRKDMGDNSHNTRKTW